MKKMNVKNLKAGKTVYYVHALGDKSFVTKYIVAGRPYVHVFKNLPKAVNDNSLFVPAKYVFSNGEIGIYNSDFSLLDCNVGVKNSYNKHRLFFKKKAADRYCAMCKELNIGIKPQKSLFDWDYPLEMDDYYEEQEWNFDIRGE